MNINHQQAQLQSNSLGGVIGNVQPAPTASLEAEIADLHSALCMLESEAAGFISSLSFVSFEGANGGVSGNKVVEPVLPAALSAVRAARERVQSVCIELSDARGRLTL